MHPLTASEKESVSSTYYNSANYEPQVLIWKFKNSTSYENWCPLEELPEYRQQNFQLHYWISVRHQNIVINMSPQFPICCLCIKALKYLRKNFVKWIRELSSMSISKAICISISILWIICPPWMLGHLRPKFCKSNKAGRNYLTEETSEQVEEINCYPVILSFLLRVLQSLKFIFHQKNGVQWLSYCKKWMFSNPDYDKTVLWYPTDLVSISYLLKFFLCRRITLICIWMILLSKLHKAYEKR